MWHPQKLETKASNIDFSSSGQKSMKVTEIWADNFKVTNGLELNNWSEDPIQFIVCDHCGTVQCSSGNWLSPRQAGDYVLFIPAFSEMSTGSWELTEYQPPYYVEQNGALIFAVTEYEELRKMVTGLPPKSTLKPLTGMEAVLLLQLEAPLRILGEFPDPVKFRKELFLDSNQASNEFIITELETILGRLFESKRQVHLKERSEVGEEVSFFLENMSFTEWQPLFRDGNALELFLSPGYVVDEMG